MLKATVRGLGYFASFALLTSCASSPPKPGTEAATAGTGGYSGHGSESVSPEVLRQFAPPSLPSTVSSRFQSALDIRAPGLGMLTPDARTLFFGWGVTGSAQVWKIGGPKAFPTQVTGGEDPTHLVQITPNGKHLVLMRDRKGEENPGLYLMKPAGGALEMIQHKAKVQTSFEFVTDDSRWLYFRANDVKPDSYAIYRRDLVHGTTELVFDRDGIWFVADFRDADHLLLVRAKGSLAREVFEYDVAKKELTPLFGIDEETEYDVMYGRAPGEVLVLTNRFGNFRRLYSWNLESKGSDAERFKPISAERSADVSGFSIDHPRTRVVLTLNDGGYTRLQALDARTYRDLPLPKFEGADHVYAGSFSRDGRYIALGVETAQAPRTSYVLDWKTGKLVQWVVPSAPESDLTRFSRAKLETYTARDGTPIPMFVRRPAKCENSAEPCPVIVHFHGGPEGQSTPGFSPIWQTFVDAGFILVEPNVRGSDGYGKAWLNSDNGARRLDVITDIEDCARFLKVHWAKSGKAPKIGVMGWSYGGYATLYAMTRFAGAYDAGAALVGMSDLSAFLANTAPYRRILRISEYGDPVKDADALKLLSPLTHLARIRDPLLIIQGVSDPRVPVGEAVRMHEALKRRGVPSDLILFADEGHGSQKRENRVLEYGHVLQFFEKHLTK